MGYSPPAPMTHHHTAQSWRCRQGKLACGSAHHNSGWLALRESGMPDAQKSRTDGVRPAPREPGSDAGEGFFSWWVAYLTAHA